MTNCGSRTVSLYTTAKERRNGGTGHRGGPQTNRVVESLYVVMFRSVGADGEMHSCYVNAASIKCPGFTVVSRLNQ